MAGFMSPGLGFASTVGAFIGGAAHQINQNIEQQRNQDRQDDLIWMNKFERSRLEYEKEKETTDSRNQAYNAILQAANGNKQLADQAFIGVGMDPKHYFDAINWIKANQAANPGYTGDPNYKSTVQESINAPLNGRYQALQDIYNTVRPQARKFMSMPDQYNNSGNNNQSSGSGPGLITGGPGGPNPSNTSGASPTNSAPVQPTITQNTPQTPQNGNTITNSVGQTYQNNGDTYVQTSPSNPNISGGTRGAGEPATGPIPPDQTSGPVTPVAPTSSSPITPTPNVPTQIAQNTTTGGAPGQNYIPFGSNKPSNAAVLNPLDPNTWQHFSNRDALEQAMISNGVPPQVAHTRAQGAQTAEETNAQAMKLRPNAGYTPEQLAELEVRKDDAKKYLHENKNGLYPRFYELGNLQRQNQDISEIIGVLNRGFKASSIQPAYDELNRFTTGLLGVSLNDLGIQSNSYQDVNLMRKAVANGIISRLSTLHFGRITNFEVGLIQKGFTSNENDPNTNIQIALALKYSTAAAMNQVSQEKAIYRSTLKSTHSIFQAIDAAQEAGEQAADKYYNTGNSAPWQQYTEGITPNTLPQIAKMQEGTWFEGSGGRMLQYMGNNNGRAIIRDATGVVKQFNIQGASQ